MAECKIVQDAKYQRCFSALMKRIEKRTRNIFDSILAKIGTNTVKANYVLEMSVHVSADIILALEEIYDRKIVEENIGEAYFLIFQANREEKLDLLEKEVQLLKKENRNLRKRQRLE